MTIDELTRGSDGERSARRHGVPRVGDEIDDRGFELPRIDLHRGAAFDQIGDEEDVGADHPLEHAIEIGDERVQIEDARLKHLLSAEGEELAREGRGAITRVVDLLQVRAHGVVRAEPLQEGVGVAEDHGEQIVEVVRHAPGEAADGLHLLRLA